MLPVTVSDAWPPVRVPPWIGHVCGQEDEWGYFVLSELEAARGPLNLPIERDLSFTPGPFSQVMAIERRNRGE